MAFESLASPSGSLRKNLSQAERLRGVWSLRGFMQEPNGYGAWLLSADDDDGTSKLTTRTITMMTMVMTIIGRARILRRLLWHFEAGVVTGLFSSEALQPRTLLFKNLANPSGSPHGQRTSQTPCRVRSRFSPSCQTHTDDCLRRRSQVTSNRERWPYLSQYNAEDPLPRPCGTNELRGSTI